ncbi:hypothetical protein D3C75_1253450 [compost metagenome]
MNLQGADARSQVHHRNFSMLLNGLHQRMNLEAEQEIQFHIPVFHQKVGITTGADRNRKLAACFFVMKNRIIRCHLGASTL